MLSHDQQGSPVASTLTAGPKFDQLLIKNSMTSLPEPDVENTSDVSFQLNVTRDAI